MSLVAKFADFITGLEMATLPEDVAERARLCLLNGLGVGMGCHDTPYAPVARQAILTMEGERPDGATILGDGRRTTIGGAALANSALFHGRAQEDASGAAHLGAELIPLAVAMIEARGYPLDRLLPALVAGYEIGGLLEEAHAGDTTPGGFRSSTIYGPIACAAMAARLMDLPADRTAAALALAASFTGGILQSFTDGTDEWRYQLGWVGRSAFLAAELARAGARTAPHAIEGKVGLIRAFARVEPQAGKLASTLGREWKIHRVAFKPFPVCAFNQSPVTAALSLREKIGGRAISAVDVRMNPYETGYAGMDAYGPFDSVSGTLMSIPFCIAQALVHGAPTMQRMTTYDDPQVNALERKITLVSDPQVATLCCRIEARLDDGTEIAEDLKMTARDYAYDREGTLALIRRIGAETGVPGEVYDRLERFVYRLPEGDIGDVVSAFAQLDRASAA